MDKKNIFIIVLAVLTIAGFGWGFYEMNRTETAATTIENDASRAFYELMDAVDELTVLSSKAIVVTDNDNRARLYSEMSSYAYVAQENLSMLPVYNGTLARTQQFLNQMGDFSYSLIGDAARGEALTAAELDTLKTLNANVVEIAEALHELESNSNDYFSYDAIQAANKSIADGDYDNAGLAVSSLNTINDGLSSTPTLIYDGPYSDNLENKGPVTLAGEEIDWATAREKAKAIFGDTYTYEAYGKSSKAAGIAVYTVAVMDGENDESPFGYFDISITGGYPVQYTADTEDGEQAISKEEALSNSDAFMTTLGYTDMKAGYYMIENNILTVNYTYQLNGVTVYPDMIKISVDMGSGEIVGLDAKSYLENHKDRSLPTLILTEDTAKEHLAAGITPLSCQRVIIPKNTDDEVYCYEFRFKENNTEYLLYINAETGKEEDVLIVKDNESGTFTM
jgi:germination protein YpeB